ncbi:transposase [Desulfosarcina ovata]|uniref:Transposase IS200-like domain-containing protein n=1 Tax=Desulfosarcina ovata subsp. ovata TaxID=2752305 RepID=A0A5K8AEC6_9BACT|nr:transposase [Desulfosarcina ovata]BBO90310.1 hypothetical protein DSCOOX_34900 [Desulfosarcina ovata subsp. ovata]
MNYDPTIHKRRSIRLKGYDYSSPGAYFITLCTHGQVCLFGDITDGHMKLNDAGRIVTDEWIQTAVIRNEIELDEWVVMPNHFHGIVFLRPRRGTARRAPTTTREQFGKPVAGSLPTIVRAFKSAVTRRINEMRRTPGAKVWQRNYWEHIIRSEPELSGLREYIRNNPVQWTLDQLYRAP